MSEDIKIVKLSPKYKEDFKKINLWWIGEYFEVEESDIKVLNEPEKYIIDMGGEIFLALYKDEVVGTCALIKSKNENFDFELAKLAVLSKVQGLKLGLLLSQAVITEAKNRGGKTIFLETNSVLTPAVSLYKKLGFEEIPNFKSKYKRVNLVMLKNL
ncbi:GNAT family N-acetyltransferase [Aliarcobacter butzleri]|uniref:GNAT family N-acetyltransferase n=1 Tax=Aliarcobacter butzleri TaxID=28197 RepID=UPI003AF43F34